MFIALNLEILESWLEETIMILITDILITLIYEDAVSHVKQVAATIK